jgi:hypothetical protein
MFFTMANCGELWRTVMNLGVTGRTSVKRGERSSFAFSSYELHE